MARPSIREYQIKRANAPNGDKVWHIVGRPNGKRIRAWFKTKEAAQAEATERNLAMRKLGENAVALDAVLAETARDGATRLKPFGKTLKDAIDFYLSHLIALRSSISARELESRIVARFDRRMRVGEISTRYLESIKDTLGKFAGKYENESIATLSGVEIKEWLANLPLVPKSCQRHFSTLRTAFNIACREWKVIAANPFEGLDGFRVKRKDKIEILTPAEVEKFLIALDPDWLPFFAIWTFSGLRRQEVARLDWTEVKLDRALIDLPPAKSKNNRRKLEEIPANLAAILAPYARPAGRVMPRNKIQRGMENAAKKAGITWKQNVLRHSFCSYGVAVRGLEWTADQADHDIRILRRNYREVVSRQEAEAYFRIGSSPIPAISS